MSRLHVVWILTFALSARATPYQVYKSSLNRDDAVKTVFQLHIDGDSDCTGVFIGSQGEALTSLHCLEKCLTKSGVVRQESVSSMTKNLIELDPKHPVSCPGDFMQSGKSAKVDYQVVHIFGPGFLSPRDRLFEFSETNPQLFRQALRDGFEGFGDLALIRINSAEKTSCARVNHVDFGRTDPVGVYNLSFPIVMRVLDRSNPFSPNVLLAMGTTLLYTEGKATEKVGLPEQNLQGNEEDALRSEVGPGTILTSVDCEGGASGSPLFDASGGVVGVLRATFNPSQTDYRAWMTQAVDLSVHLQEIRTLVPSNLTCLSGSIGVAD